MGNELSVPITIESARFQAFAQIRKKLAPTWDALYKKKFDYMMEPTSTKDNASALHALLGKENSLGYIETDISERAKICKELRNLVPFKNDSKARKYLKESLVQLFEEEEQSVEKGAANKKSSSSPPPSTKSLTPTLDIYSKLYGQSDSDDEFDWGSLLDDKKALKEYFDFLAEPQIPFLTSDLQLIAHIKEIPIKILNQEFKPLKEDNNKNLVDDSKTLCILMDDTSNPFEYHRVTALPALDRNAVYAKILSILNEVYLFDDIFEIARYLSLEQFGVTKLKDFEDLGSISKMSLIDKIVSSMDSDLSQEEKLRLKMAFSELPKVCLLVIRDRFDECDTEEFRTNLVNFVSNYFQDFILDSDSIVETPFNLLMPLIWTMASYPQGEWILQFGLVKLQETFFGVRQKDLKKWATLLEQMPDNLVHVIVQLVGWEEGERQIFRQFGPRDKEKFTKFLKGIKDISLDLTECKTKDFKKLLAVPHAQWTLHLPKIYMFTVLDNLPNAAWDEEGNKKSQALYHLYSLYNLKPIPTIELLQELKKALIRGGENDTGGKFITSIISKFNGGWWDLGEETIKKLKKSSSVEKWLQNMVTIHSLYEDSNGGQRTLEEVMQIIENDGNSSLKKCDMEKIQELINTVDNPDIPNEHKFRKNLNSAMSKWLQDFKVRRHSMPLLQAQMECLAYVNLAMTIKLKFKDGLRPSQKFAIVGALYLGSLERSLLSQMATGEGKTCVVLALAIIRGVFGQQSDIVTSSEVLAKRDAAVYKNLYALFELTVGDVTSPYLHIRKQNYACDVVYGTSTEFQGDYIRDLFYKRGTRGKRPYLNVIIDEVDTMLLDNGMGVVYLSHDPADMNSLEDVLVHIWTSVVAAVNSGDYQIAEIHENVMRAIYPTLDMEDLELFLNDPQDVQGLWDWMVDEKVINEWGRLQFGSKVKGGTIWSSLLSIFSSKLGSLDAKAWVHLKLGRLPESFEKIKRQLQYLIEKTLESWSKVEVMDHLKPIVDRNLYIWIENAYWATRYTEGIEYVVDITDHSDGSSQDKTINAKIIPMNLSTGVDQANTTWSNGLHQFLQMKHGCKVSTLSSIGIFISGITFFKLYTRKFGLTGTMGTPSDRKFLKDTYNVEFLSVPLAQAKRFIEEEPKKCISEDNWKEEIYKEIIEKTMEKKRSVLTICRTVKEAKALYDYLVSMDIPADKIQLYTRDYQKFKAAQGHESLRRRQILISTNLAGRGTDIKLSDKLKEAGGLHVILSYLPANLRVEQQALGRAARSGDPGSGKIIFHKYGARGEVDAIDLKILRDEEESSRVSNMLKKYEDIIYKKEQMFDTFKASYHALDEAMEKNKGDKKMGEVILESMLDKWSLWLNEYTFYLEWRKDKDAVQLLNRGRDAEYRVDEDHLKRRLMQMIGRFDAVKSAFEDKNLSKDDREGRGVALIEEPGLMVKVAKVYINRGIGFRDRFKREEVEKALSYLEKVFRIDKNSLPALYYKLHCKLRLGQWNTSEFQKLSEKIVKLLEERQEKQFYYSSLISQIGVTGSSGIVKTEGYQTQKENEIRLYGIFKGSIDKMTGNQRMNVGQDLGGLKEVRKRPGIAEHLEKYLIENGVLLEPEFQYFIEGREEKIEKLADQFCLRKDQVRDVLREMDGKKIKSRKVEKKLKNLLKLPYRGGFWNEIWTCLGACKTYAVVKKEGGKVGEKDEAASNDYVQDWWCQGSVQQTTCFLSYLIWGSSSNQSPAIISKYGLNEAASKNMESVTRGSKKDFKSQQKYKYLRKMGRLSYESVATLDIESLKKLILTRHSKVERDSFTLIQGLDYHDSSKIFKILLKAGVINATGELLSTEWTKDGENHVDFKEEYEVYRADILNVLQNCCRYKYELLSIIQQYDEVKEEREKEALEKKKEKKEGNIEVKFSLPVSPWKDFLAAALELGFVKGIRPCPAFFENYGGIEVFQEPTKWAKWIGKKLGISGKDEENKEEKVPEIGYWDLRELFPEEKTDFLLELRDDVQGKKWILTGDNIPSGMKQKYEYYLPEVTALTQWEAAKGNSKLIADATKECFEARGKLQILDNPDAELNHLKEYIGSSEEAQLSYREEIESFEMASFEHVIDTVERKYTWKMIGSAILVFLLGLVQVVIGVLITFFSMGIGTWIGSAFIQEGISDMIYSGMAFWNGRFSWQDYINHKWQSIAITVATMGIAALLSKAVKYSKYGARLFGLGGEKMSGRVITQTLKGGAQGGVRRSVWKVLAKSVGYKVLQSGALAAGNMAVSYVYEKVLQQAVENLVRDIFSKMYENAHNSIENRLKGYISTLADKVGSVRKANLILGECLQRAMADSDNWDEDSIAQDLIAIQKVAMNGIMEATGKIASAGAMSSTNAAAIMMIGKLASGVMSVAAVLDSLNNLEKHVDKLIAGVEVELRQEVRKLPQCNSDEKVSKEGKKQVMCQFKKEVDKVLNQKLEHVMRYQVVEPLMSMGCQKLLTDVGRFMRGAMKEVREGMIRKNINDTLKARNNKNLSSAEKLRLEKKLLNLCARARKPETVALAVENGVPLGKESLQVLANTYGVRIVVKSGNDAISDVIEPSGGDPKATLHMKHTPPKDLDDLGHWESSTGTENKNRSRNNNQNNADCLLNAFNEELKRKLPSQTRVNRSSLANQMRNDADFHDFVKNGYHHSYFAAGGFGGAKKDIFYPIERAELQGPNATQTARDIKEYRDELKEDPDVNFAKVKDKPGQGPVHERATTKMTNQKGKDVEVLLFQSGEVKPEHLTNLPRRPGDNVKFEVFSDQDADSCDQAGHNTPQSHQGPPTVNNLFPQHPKINQGVDNAIAREVNNFLKENKDDNPSVKYMIKLVRNDRSRVRPTEYVLHHEYRINGAFHKERVFNIPNPRARRSDLGVTKQPARRHLLRRGRGT